MDLTQPRCECYFFLVNEMNDETIEAAIQAGASIPIAIRPSNMASPLTPILAPGSLSAPTIPISTNHAIIPTVIPVPFNSSPSIPFIIALFYESHESGHFQVAKWPRYCLLVVYRLECLAGITFHLLSLIPLQRLQESGLQGLNIEEMLHTKS